MRGEDRISKLPDAILSQILSPLPTREAVRTSILSTRWRYLFALVTNLDFELDDKFLRRRKGQKRSTIKCFTSFADRMLFFHNTRNMENFRLKCREGVDCSRVYGWISATLWRRVQHLDLCIPWTSCQGFSLLARLVTMKLNINGILEVPKDVCLPNLRTLHVKSILFSDDDSVNRLLSNCIALEDLAIRGRWENISKLNICHPLLKRLTIDHGDFSIKIAIDAPNLVYFKYITQEVAAGYSLVNLRSLVSVDINFVLSDDAEKMDRTHLNSAAEFFRGIKNLRILDLSFGSLELLLCNGPLPVFGNMAQLNICHNNRSLVRYYSYMWEKGLATLLGSSPKLKKLSFPEEVFGVRYGPEGVPSCLLFTLKEIEISDFEAEKICIEKAKDFIENARCLQRLTIRTYHYTPEKDKLKITEELLASPRKSKQCCILIV